MCGGGFEDVVDDFEDGHGGSLKAGTIVPHADFRGTYDMGSTVAGAGVSGVDWPGRHRETFGDEPNGPRIPAWHGSLIQDQVDGSGLQYRRNRYYDPKAGVFTQEDPIALAGGMNLYGFAGGDPVNFSDPFGLCPWCSGAGAGALLGAGGTVLYNYLNDQPLSTNVVRNTIVGAGVGATLGLGWQVMAARAGTSVVAAEATAAGTAAANKIPFEGFVAWGRSAIGWGQNAAGAAKAMAEMTVERAAMLDPAKVQAAKAFYENAVANERGGAAARARVELMQKILDLQKK